MLTKLVATTFLISGTLMTFLQNDYTLKFERIEVMRHDERYAKGLKMVTYKFNRTTPVANTTFTYTVDFDNELEVIVQAFTLLSNEYRLFPLRFQFNFCKAVARNDYGLVGFYGCGNFSRCPIKKGHYHICHWAPDPSKFPPHIPNGNYKLELQVVWRNTEVMALNFYAAVTRPIHF